MRKLKILALASIMTTSVAIASPQISANNNDLYMGNSQNLNIKHKPIVLKPIGVELQAPAWVSINYRTGNVVSEKNMNKRRAPASLTKIMTSYIVASQIKAGTLSWNTMIPISQDAASTGGSKMFVKTGAKLSVRTLVRGMDVVSGNDATVALAEYIGGSKENFTKLMNETAKSIGMNNTHFANPDGLPGGTQYTTAYDMAILARSYIYNFPKAYSIYAEKGLVWNATQQKIVSIENRKMCLPKFDHSSGSVINSYTASNLSSSNKAKCSELFPIGDNFVLQNNRNKLLFTFKGADGMKTGHTGVAGYNLVASAKQNGERYITTVLGTSSSFARVNESAKLLRYSLDTFENLLLYKKDTPIQISANTINDAKKGQTLSVVSNQTIYKTIPKNYVKYLKQGIELDKSLKAPIKAGQQVGNLVISVDGLKGDNIVAKAPIFAGNNIEKSGWW